MSSKTGSARSQKGLLVGIFSIAAALLVVSLVVTWRSGDLAQAAQLEMSSQLDIVNRIRELESTVKDSETGQRGFLLTGEESYLEPYITSLPKLTNQLADLQQLAASNELSPAILERTSVLIRRKLEELAKTIRLRRETGADAALAEVKSDRGKNIMDDIRLNCSQLLKEAQAEYNAAVESTNRTNLYRSITYVGVTILNLAFLTWAFRKISQQEWLQFGRAQLTEKMAGDQQLQELGEKAVGFLAEYLGAHVAAIFVEDAGTYQRFATYAVPAGQNLVQKFAIGEGLLGQAAKDQRAILVRDVPKGYLAVGSSLGVANPRQLIIAPMKMDDEVNAVIELGFLREPQKMNLVFLENISEVVSVAVRSAKYRTRLQQLLEETQRQSEELQSQTEELRVSNEELEEQSRAIKESQARLEQQQVELEQTNSQLEEQTQILEHQKDDLARAKTELETQAAIVEQASRYKSDFLANMSHELRTPLNSSLILAKLLGDNREGNLTTEQVKYAQTIQSAGNDLLNLINDVLDLSKVEAGHMDLKAETFSPAELLESMRGTFEPLATDKGLVLRMSLSEGVAETIKADRRRLEQVLKNVLSNAIKFTERGEVSLLVNSATNRSIAFVVRDTGIGIAANQQENIFEPFCQADSTTSRKFGGTGLGLSISRELIRLMGGSIKVTSELGKGSVFTVSLPEQPPVDKPRPISRTTQLVPDRRELSPSSSPLAQPGRSSLPPSNRANRSGVADDREKLEGSGRIILIVEDDEAFAAILIDLGRELNFQCLIAGSAEEALALAVQFQPHAIILDIGLPDNSGMFVLERLKGDVRTRHIPVHVVSGSDHSEPALSMGAVGYMLKPVRREQLIEAFRKLEVRLTQKLRRVLVVEDDAIQLDSLRQLLGSRDVTTVGVRTAAECLEKLKDSTFDCMVLDLSLPDASGFALLETLSAEDMYSFPPVIIYTGHELSLDEEQRLRKYSKSIIIKGAKSPERLLDEVTLFLHQVVADLPPEKQQLLEKARSRDAALEGKRILVVEDDVRNVFALTALLEPKGAVIQIARNGRESLNALAGAEGQPDKKIDLVLMDIMMPEMNGLDAMREIRKNTKWQRLPIIALTAKAMRDDQEQCLQAGASDYLAKPLDVEKLLSLIHVWMPR